MRQSRRAAVDIQRAAATARLVTEWGCGKTMIPNTAPVRLGQIRSLAKSPPSRHSCGKGRIFGAGGTRVLMALRPAIPSDSHLIAFQPVPLGKL